MHKFLIGGLKRSREKTEVESTLDHTNVRNISSNEIQQPAKRLKSDSK